MCTKELAEVPQKASAITIAKHHDATPATLAFGSMTEQVYPHAKYIMKDTSCHQRWTLVDFATYASKFPTSRPERGVLQLFAQTCSLFWMEKKGTHETLVQREIYDMPKILQRGNASTIFNAVEGYAAPLPMPSIKALANDVEYVMVTEVPDNCSANVLKKAQTILEYQDVPNVFYYHDACLAHKLTAILRQATAEADLIGHLHAVAYVANMPRYRAQLLKALRSIVQEDLETHFHVGEIPPSDEWAADSDEICSKTVLRESRVAGSQQPHSMEWETVSAQKRRAMEKLKQFVNGSPHSDFIAHYCNEGCQCLNRQDAVEKVYACILDAKLLGPFQVPSKNRWGSASLTLAQVSAGMLISAVLPRAFLRAFGDAEAEQARAPEDEDDFRAACRKKMVKALHFFQERKPGQAMQCLVACWLSEGVHSYWREVEYHDARGDALLHVVQKDMVAYDLTKALLKSTEAWSRPLHLRFATHVEGQSKLCATIRSMASAILGQLHSRIVLHFEKPQFHLLHLLAPDLSAAQKQETAATFMGFHDCCLNPEFARKIKSHFRGSATPMLESASFLELLKVWAKTTHITNMHVEREFAASKQCCPQKTPLAQRLAATMFLDKLARIHRAAGGADCKYGKTRETCSRGSVRRVGRKVLGNSSRCAKRNPKRDTGLFHYLHSRCPKRLSRAVRRQKFKDLSNEFKRLPLPAQRVWLPSSGLETSLQDEPELVDHYSVHIGDKLWGCSTQATAVSADVLGTFLKDTWAMESFSLRQVFEKAEKGESALCSR